MKPVPQRMATRRATFMTPASFIRSRVILPNESGLSNDSGGPAATPAPSGQEPRRCVRTACGWARARDRSDVGRLERRKDILRDFVIILDAAHARKRLEHGNSPLSPSRQRLPCRRGARREDRGCPGALWRHVRDALTNQPPENGSLLNVCRLRLRLLDLLHHLGGSLVDVE